jgi:hypothetical protein
LTKEYINCYSQVLLIEEVAPFCSLHMRDLSKAATKLEATATMSVEPTGDRDRTWIEEAIFSSLGSNRVVQ